jgi:hypothetical protein
MRNERPKKPSRVEFRIWEHEVWDDSTTPLVPIYTDCVNGCEPSSAVGAFEYCTGLCDKNGTPIYENDYLLLKDKEYVYTYQIRWNPDWLFYELFDLDSQHAMHFEQGDNNELEIVGNMMQGVLK